MKNLCTISILLFLIVKITASPLQSNYKHSIIIDTDCAIDDMRAISILLSLPNITIKAIMVSDGSLPPNEGVLKVKSLLHKFNRDTIPVMCGNELKDINPAWREFNHHLNWGEEANQSGNNLNLQQIADIIKNSPEQISLICLGPLTNVAQLITNHSNVVTQITNIIWYNESANLTKGFNFECDKKAAETIFSTKIKINIISNLNNETAVFNTSLYNTCKNSSTLLAKVLYNTHNQPLALEKLKQNHFKLCDDLVALYVINPELFDMNITLSNLNVRYNQYYNVMGVKEAMCDIIKGSYVSERNIVFNRFPNQRELFNYDVRQIIDTAIARYGNDEWKAIVITDEFHGHLGVFSIVGAKMGIKACELFGVGPDFLEVTTFAGSKPPYSCLNDGIQVSTGATLGMGTIHLGTDSITRPSAIFSYKNRSILISLKKEYLEKLDADIKEGIVKFGLMDDGYWKLVRRNALKYWVEWDRNKIFDIEISSK